MFNDLPVGLCLVTETQAPPAALAASAVMVALPTTDQSTGGSWLHDVTVHPKNAVTTITKSVDAARPGDAVTYTIIGDIPAATGPDATVIGYRITDVLDDRLHDLSATPSSATLSPVTSLP